MVTGGSNSLDWRAGGNTIGQVMVVSLQNTARCLAATNSPDCALSDVMRRLSSDVTKYHHNYQVTGHVTSANILCPSYTQVISLLGLSTRYSQVVSLNLSTTRLTATHITYIIII